MNRHLPEFRKGRMVNGHFQLSYVEPGTEPIPQPAFETTVDGNEDQYTVRQYHDGGWTCTCPDYRYRRAARRDICKHIGEIQWARADLLFDLRDALPSLIFEADQYAEGCALADMGNGYRILQNDVSHLIDQLKRFHAELGARARHEHAWDNNDYCRICGADERA